MNPEPLKLGATLGETTIKIVEMTVWGDVLIIGGNLSREFGPSSSGKTIIITSIEGNASIPGVTIIAFLYLGQNISFRDAHYANNPEHIKRKPFYPDGVPGATKIHGIPTGVFIS